MKSDKTESARGDEPMTLWQTLQSVAAAMFGVQSQRNRERDPNLLALSAECRLLGSLASQ